MKDRKFSLRGLFSASARVADKTVDYLKRHPEMDCRLTRGGTASFLTSDTAKFFEKGASLFGMTGFSAESVTF